MQLYAKIVDRESYHTEHIVLCEFKDAEGKKCFVEETTMDGQEVFKVVLDEGYCRTEYYFPTARYSISDLRVYL